MSNRTIKHEIKLQPSVIVILGLLALGVCANAFAPVFSVKEVSAAIGDASWNPVYIKCVSGCK